MCSITGSFSKEKLRELVELNKNRGITRHSVMSFDTSGSIVYQKTGESLFTEFEKLPADCYTVAHHQAPTALTSSFHPARHNTTRLFHNGIIKARHIEKMKTLLNTKETWDTQLLAQDIDTNGFGALKDIDGSFACVMIKNFELFVFRNQLAPMFVDKDLNISSLAFAGAKSLDSEIVFSMNLKAKIINQVFTFGTLDVVYFFE